MSEIITRFPPSPTGYLHVGGARTALFNWLYARHTKGRFVLRIEDTDTERSTQESTDAILESLEWLGIDWDEGPYFQSQRIEIHNEYIDRLIAGGHAYHCSCTPEEIENMRNAARARGENPKYDGTCREKGLPPGEKTVVRFKSPATGNTVIEDVVKGNIVIPNSELDDFIIRRSDGMPTYNLAVVVDDITMNINTVIRGDDHVNNTPKQIQLYKALGCDLPTYGHVPMVLGNDRTRLSKRHGAMSVTAYREMGYLPDALLNYLVRLGWSFGDQEFFTKSELVEKFTLENIGRSAGIFDQDKLLALNAEHIKTTPAGKIAPYLRPHLKAKDISAEEGEYLESVIKTLNTRSKTLLEMADGAEFYYLDELNFDEKAVQKFFKKAIREPLYFLTEALKKVDPFSESNLEEAFKAVIDRTGLKFGKIAQPVRVALTGKTVSPGIFEIIEVLGKDRVLSRMRKAIDMIDARPE